jgi:iron complex outermembrane receptor protein
VTLRGVAGANTTSFYINDTPVPLSLDPRILDVQRVEALSGPQGSLFGSSAMGGTVRIITRAADAKQAGGASTRSPPRSARPSCAANTAIPAAA